MWQFGGSASQLQRANGCRKVIEIFCHKNKYHPSTDMRIYEKHQNYRYAKKTQISLDPKKYRYVGDIYSFGKDVVNELAAL